MRLQSSGPKTTVLGRMAAHGVPQPCILTWYDPALGGTNSSSGQPSPHSATASGEPYDPNKLTCAAPPKYSYGTMITFTYNGTSVTCRVNDRGGAIQGNHFDLSRKAAQILGIFQAGRVNASFVVGGSAGATAAANAAGSTAAGGGGGLGGGVSVIQILEDIATLNVSDLAVQLALVGVTVAKDTTLGLADFIVIPFWQWNQRAVAYFISNDLFSKDPAKWTVTPWTAAFWGLGYWLLWTEPGSSSLKPVAVRRSRLAHHARTLQSVPARRSLVKPKDVQSKTPRKPKPVVSRAVVTQQGTMRADRTLPVRIHGDHPTQSETPIESTGTGASPHPEPHSGQNPAASRKPNAKH